MIRKLKIGAAVLAAITLLSFAVFAWDPTDPPYVEITTPVANALYRSRVQQILIAGYVYTQEASGFQSYILEYHIPTIMVGWTQIYENDTGTEKGEGGSPETLCIWDTSTIREAVKILPGYMSGRRSATLNLRLTATGNNGYSASDTVTITIRKGRSARPRR